MSTLEDELEKLNERVSQQDTRHDENANTQQEIQGVVHAIDQERLEREVAEIKEDRDRLRGENEKLETQLKESRKMCDELKACCTSLLSTIQPSKFVEWVLSLKEG